MNKSRGWYYYNRAYLSDTQPHQIVDASQVLSGEIWKKGHSKAILARWTSDFDSSSECNWWYIIKDTPFDIHSLKSNRRYRINQGLRNFNVNPINPKEYIDDLYRVQCEAYKSYPQKYRPNHSIEEMKKCADVWFKNPGYTIFGAFHNETSELCGYAVVLKESTCLDYQILKVNPSYERSSINHAIMASVLEYYSDLLCNGYYICNGERNVQHETNFQKFLKENFGYRTAYCKLHVEYNPKYKWIIKILYVFRKILQKFDNIRIVHKINGVLKMEEIVRQQEKNKNG